MGSTYASLHYHAVFSTKDRKPSIAPDWRSRCHAYLGGTIRGLNGIPEAVGGVEDHVYILMGLRPSACVADTIRECKKQMTSWIKEHHDPRFAWQEGYAVFSISASGIVGVKSYIATQERHHNKISYLDELRGLLDDAGVPYDERYLV